MGHGQVVISAGGQPIYLFYQKVSFKGMAGSAAGRGAQGGVGFPADLLYPLGGPKQEGELQQAHAFPVSYTHLWLRAFRPAGTAVRPAEGTVC